jgi:cytoskeletal protein CcmA (bactofilin family)
MFKENKKDGAADGPLLAVFGKDACLEGKFTIGDSIQIECEIAGEINVEGKLVIGKKGVVRADVNTVDAMIRGQYQGNMVATGDVEIAETGRVIGNIETDSLVISKGGFFNGVVSKMSQPAGKEKKRHSGPALVDADIVDRNSSSGNRT